ncbi:hypothetical protein [Lentibacter sp.]|uniref:hypothetical protein n=1 Tax=Lentibacter sp. TaxID=2024994 RepID=UPI003F6B0FA1
MSTYSEMADGLTKPQALGQSVAALVAEITRLKLDITALRARVNATEPTLSTREVQFCLEEVAQWMGIALEVEQTYEKQSKHTRSARGERGLDLEAARLSIGGKLDRLRAAAGAERVSELAE